MTSGVGDLRYAARTLAKNPGFTAVAVLTLALGIGANGAAFSVLRALLLRPLPYRDASHLVMLWSRWSGFPKTWVSVEESRSYAAAGCFTDVALFDPGQANLTGSGEPERVGSADVSANLFAVLGVQPLLGRTFRAAEVSSHPANVVLLSEEIWHRRYGGDPAMVGSSVDINGVPREVVGIMPAGLKLPLDYASASPSALWLPLAEDLTGAFRVPPMGGDHNYCAIARLRQGISTELARERLTEAANQLTADGVYPRSWHFEPLTIPVVEDILGPLRIALLVLSGAAGCVLLIACGNVANLLLVRGLQRQREMAIRTALGALPSRLLRQLLAESGLLALAGGTGGLGLSWLAVQTVRRLAPLALPRSAEIGVDAPVVAFVAAAALTTALLFGLSPALRLSRPNLQAGMREGGRGSLGNHRRTQSLLVGAEVALAVVLLLGANLMIRTFWSLSHIEPGFHAAHQLTLGISPPRVQYTKPEALIRLYDEILDRVRQIPGVRAAGAIRALPLATELGDWGLNVEGFLPPPGERVQGDWQIATPGYFEAMGIPLRLGRLFTSRDRREAQPVILVSRAMAERFWPGRDPLGRRIAVRGPGPVHWSTVVGVVGDVHHNGLTAEAKGTWYLPRTQFDLSTGALIPGMTLVVDGRGDARRLSGPVREAIRRVDPQLPLSELRPLVEVVHGAAAKERFTMLFLILCSSLALTLAALGVYGVVRFQVGSRRREIGLRMALGARRAQVLRPVLGQGMAPVGAGLAIGLLAAVGLTRSLGALLYGVTTSDPLTLAGTAVTLGVVALLAIWIPARQATRVDPVAVLRDE